MMVRTRRSINDMAADDPTLTWYRSAVAEMLPKSADDPESWRYQAFVHGVPRGTAIPGWAGEYWEQCNHQNWFFLSWHRAYLTVFEAVVASTIERLGGPTDWALPFWDYSALSSREVPPRLMHPAFLERTLQDGSPNALWSRRAAVANGDFRLSDDVVSLQALATGDFTSAVIGLPSGFGGPDSLDNPGSNNGELEAIPHNRVHTRIGGQSGFMSSTATAALDPIFWIHHANIDRLWEVWRNREGVSGSPRDRRWLTATKFKFKGPAGAPMTFTGEDVLDTTTILHGYRYEGVPVAQEPDVTGVDVLGAEARNVSNPILLGANAGPLDLGAETRTEVTIDAGAVTLSPASGMRTYLNLENVTGWGVPGDFAVYIGLPGDDHEAIRVGTLTTFGLERASDPDGMHGGSGINEAFDITEAADELSLRPQDADVLAVTFLRDDPLPTDDETPAELEDYAAPDATPPAISVGRVSLFQA